ncbi:MAG: hypothetical protein ACRD4R_11055 [Candidatus Acidiferrales bacterium]
MNPATISELLIFLERLKAARIYYSLSDPIEGAVTVEISVPGERWEIEFHQDGQINVEVFVSSKGVQGPELVDDLFRRFSS